MTKSIQNEVIDARTAYHKAWGVPISAEYTRFLQAVGEMQTNHEHCLKVLEQFEKLKDFLLIVGNDGANKAAVEDLRLSLDELVSAVEDGLRRWTAGDYNGIKSSLISATLRQAKLAMQKSQPLLRIQADGPQKDESIYELCRKADAALRKARGEKG